MLWFEFKHTALLPAGECYLVRKFIHAFVKCFDHRGLFYHLDLHRLAKEAGLFNTLFILINPEEGN